MCLETSRKRRQMVLKLERFCDVKQEIRNVWQEFSMAAFHELVPRKRHAESELCNE